MRLLSFLKITIPQSNRRKGTCHLANGNFHGIPQCRIQKDSIQYIQFFLAQISTQHPHKQHTRPPISDKAPYASDYTPDASP